MSLTQFMSETKAAFPKFHLVKKSESSFMKVLAKLLFVINPTSSSLCLSDWPGSAPSVKGRRTRNL